MADGAVSFLLQQLYAVLCDELNLSGGLKEEVQSIKHEFEKLRGFLIVADAKEETDANLKACVAELRGISYDVEDVLDNYMLRFRRRRGTNGFVRFLKKIGKCCQKTAKIQRYVFFYRSWLGHYGRGDALLLEDEEIVGVEKPKQQLLHWIRSTDSGRAVISVVGMGGLGKTTLVKKVYDEESSKTSFDRHVWLVVSDYKELKHVFENLIRKLVGETKESQPQELNVMSIDEMRKYVYDFLKEKKYIIVLDDVWELSTWEAIKVSLPRKGARGCVIITTRNNSIGNDACSETETNRVYELKPLSERKSRQLFLKKTFPGSRCPDYLEEFAEKILKRCEGLPLAIILIGGLLAKKTNRADEWELLNRSLSDELEGGSGLERLRRLFSLSYNDLPFYLKYCFSYLSIFPEGGMLEKEKILRLWAAEGFVQLEQGKIPEEVAAEYLNELCSRSLIQVAEKHDDGRVRGFRVHDLLREYITLRSRDHNIVTLYKGAKEPWSSNKGFRRLAIQNSSNLSNEMDNIKHLRSLLLFNGDHMEVGMIKELVTRCRLLKVLDLRGAPIESIPNEVFKLYHLKYLSFRDTMIKLIPKSIKYLKNLETLDLKNTDVMELPKEILKLQKLRHLSVYKYKVEDWYKVAFGHMQSFRAPPNIGSLQFLQKLCFVDADEVIVREIGKLTQLRRLGIAKLRSEHGSDLCSSIAKLTSLRSLTIGSSEESEKLDLDYSLSTRGLPFLRALFLSGYMEKVPQWIPSLHSLSTLHLRWSKLRSDPLSCLQDLPNLTYLLIQDAHVEGLSFKAHGFQKLKVVRLLELQLMEWMEVEEGSMPALHEWDVCGCELLTEAPQGIEHLKYLKYLGFYDMPEEFVNTLVEGRRRQGKNSRLAHIPYIYFSTKIDGFREYSSLYDNLNSSYTALYI